jgi:hypothetical protein
MCLPELLRYRLTRLFCLTFGRVTALFVTPKIKIRPGKLQQQSGKQKQKVGEWQHYRGD